MKTYSYRKWLMKIMAYVPLLFFAAVFLVPFLWLISTSFKSLEDPLFTIPIEFLPRNPTLDNFRHALGLLRFWPSTFNSFLFSAVTVVITVFLCSTAGYPLARMDFTGKNVVFGLFLSNLMIPFHVIMVPLYLMVLRLGINDSYLGLILPMAFQSFGIYLMRQSFASIPKELEEAARIDGCGDFRIWGTIFMPLVKPSLTALSIIVFVWQWNNFIWPLITLRSRELFPLQLMLIGLTSGMFSANWRYVCAAATLSMMPLLIFFMVFQRYFLEGGTAGALKG